MITTIGKLTSEITLPQHHVYGIILNNKNNIAYYTEILH